MSTVNTSSCTFQREMATHILYIIPESLTILAGFAALSIITYSFVRYGFRLLFHHNAKILMILLTVFCLIFSIDATFVCIMQVWKALTYKNDCDVVMLTSFCTLFRRTSLTSFVGFSCTQFFQMLERLIATIMKQKYERNTQWLGGILVLFSILSALLTIEWTLWNEDPLEEMTHCLTYSSSPTIGQRMYLVFNALLVIDLIILCAFCLLYRHNKRKILTAGLGFKYQQQENLQVLRALFPMVLINTLFVSTYILIALIARNFRDQMSTKNYRLFTLNTFIFPYVSLLLSITMVYTMKKEHQRKLQRIHALEKRGSKFNSQLYFNMYESQWSRVHK
ncbi:unnamed protein product [Caenorhabditis angaria]|uniref:G-protein coupled receptors family 1 profile domain-containing protein n=1 Tax=Caenorhabditis angaria TaxID=860376 RepID=A0A9P1J145_9PELO|nr:unnamed protein product [Caenorhabditis angaria]